MGETVSSMVVGCFVFVPGAETICLIVSFLVFHEFIAVEFMFS